MYDIILLWTTQMAATVAMSQINNQYETGFRTSTKFPAIRYQLHYGTTEHWHMAAVRLWWWMVQFMVSDTMPFTKSRGFYYYTLCKWQLQMNTPILYIPKGWLTNLNGARYHTSSRAVSTRNTCIVIRISKHHKGKSRWVRCCWIICSRHSVIFGCIIESWLQCCIWYSIAKSRNSPCHCSSGAQKLLILSCANTDHSIWIKSPWGLRHRICIMGKFSS